jgi:ketosteroid isomerase-like protein
VKPTYILLVVLLAGGALGNAGCATVTPAPSQDAAVIVELEHRFASASRERGARSAFLEFLTEDSIVLQPGPVFGRAAWESAGELQGTLDWAPDWAEAAADGEMGFSTGPWRLVTAAGTEAVAEGRYLSVWRREAGRWGVVFDGGFGRGPGDVAISLASEPRLGVARCERGTMTSAGDLQALDTQLSGTPFEPYAVRVLAGRMEEGALYHAPDVEGARGQVPWERTLRELPDTTQLWPMGGAVASSGDVGYTYGLSSPALDAAAEAAYANLWCRSGGKWRLLVQLRRPLPH